MEIRKITRAREGKSLKQTCPRGKELRVVASTDDTITLSFDMGLCNENHFNLTLNELEVMRLRESLEEWERS